VSATNYKKKKKKTPPIKQKTTMRNRATRIKEKNSISPQSCMQEPIHQSKSTLSLRRPPKMQFWCSHHISAKNLAPHPSWKRHPNSCQARKRTKGKKKKSYLSFFPHLVDVQNGGHVNVLYRPVDSRAVAIENSTLRPLKPNEHLLARSIVRKLGHDALRRHERQLGLANKTNNL
jgi:hypothetical protein